MTLLTAQHRCGETSAGSKIIVERITSPYLTTQYYYSIARLSNGRLVATSGVDNSWAYSDDDGLTWKIKSGVYAAGYIFILPDPQRFGGFSAITDASGIVRWDNDLNYTNRYNATPASQLGYWDRFSTYQLDDGRIFWGAMYKYGYSRVFADKFATLQQTLYVGGSYSPCGCCVKFNPIDGYLYAGSDEGTGGSESDRIICKVNINVNPPTITRMVVGAAAGTYARFSSLDINPETGTMFALRKSTNGATYYLNFRTTNGFQSYTTESAYLKSRCAYVNVWKKWIRWNNGWLEWSTDDGLTFEPFLELATTPFNAFGMGEFAEVPGGVVFAQSGAVLRITLQ